MSNHDELMSNFFAQPDALAYGKVISKFFGSYCLPLLASHGKFITIVIHLKVVTNRPMRNFKHYEALSFFITICLSFFYRVLYYIYFYLYHFLLFKILITNYTLHADPRTVAYGKCSAACGFPQGDFLT